MWTYKVWGLRSKALRVYVSKNEMLLLSFRVLAVVMVVHFLGEYI